MRLKSQVANSPPNRGNSTFGADINSLTISVYDPDFAGNRVIAFDSNSAVVASVDVPYDDLPTVLTIETVTVSAPRIRKVQLLPASADYVAYADASFVRAPCPPTGDPVLDSPDVRKVMLDLLAASRPNPNGTGKKELGAYLYRDADETYDALPIDDPTATDCGFTIPGGSPALPPGAVPVGVFHTHPSTAGERLYGCQDVKPGEIKRASRSKTAGGGSPPDWEGATISGAPVYVLNLNRKVARLDPGVAVSQRGNNPNQWKFNSGSDCLVLGT